MQAGEALEHIYRGIHDDLVEGIATGGSATTIVDTSLIGRHNDSKFKNWIAFITRTTDGLTPQNKYSIISANVNSTGTITFATMTDAVGAGDKYTLAKGTIPLYTLLELFNEGLRLLGRIELTDTSMTTADATLRYSLPLAVKGIMPRSLYLRDSNGNRLAAPNYEVENAAGGSQATLVFHSQPLVSQTIVYKYMGIHPVLTAYNSYINESVHDELAIAVGVERAMDWKQAPKFRKIDVQGYQRALRRLNQAKADHAIEMPIKEMQTLSIGRYN